MDSEKHQSNRNLSNLVSVFPNAFVNYVKSSVWESLLARFECKFERVDENDENRIGSDLMIYLLTATKMFFAPSPSSGRVIQFCGCPVSHPSFSIACDSTSISNQHHPKVQKRLQLDLREIKSKPKSSHHDASTSLRAFPTTKSSSRHKNASVIHIPPLRHHPHPSTSPAPSNSLTQKRWCSVQLKRSKIFYAGGSGGAKTVSLLRLKSLPDKRITIMWLKWRCRCFEWGVGEECAVAFDSSHSGFLRGFLSCIILSPFGLSSTHSVNVKIYFNYF